jgi:hypothetical protein
MAGAAAPPTDAEIEAKVLNILACYDKIDAASVRFTVLQCTMRENDLNTATQPWHHGNLHLNTLVVAGMLAQHHCLLVSN